MKRIELVDMKTIEKSCDLSKDYMPRDCQSYPYNYENTVTFDHKRHSKASAYLAERKIVQYLFSWIPSLEELILVIEYQKNGFPHYHINLGCNEAFADGQSLNIIRAFERFYGMTSLKDVVNTEKWEQYLMKDVYENNERIPSCTHYNVYNRN